MLVGAFGRHAELERWRSRPLDETPYLILDARYETVRQCGQVRSCAVVEGLGRPADLGGGVEPLRLLRGRGPMFRDRPPSSSGP